MMLPLFAQTGVTLDLSRPIDLTRAIAPDLVLCAGAIAGLVVLRFYYLPGETD